MSGALGFMMTQAAAMNPPVLVGVSAIATATDTGTLPISKPSGVAAGDMLIAFANRDTTTGSWTVPSGWNSVADDQICLAWKLAGGAEPSSYTFTASGTKPNVGGVIVAYQHCLFDAAGTEGAASSGAACVAPSVGLSDLGLLLAFFTVNRPHESFTTPDGMLSVASHLGSTASDPSFALFSQQLSAGATGTRQSTPDSGGSSAGILIAFRGT